MDVLPLLDACDMIDQMDVRKSVMTYIAQFTGMDQWKRAAS